MLLLAALGAARCSGFAFGLCHFGTLLPILLDGAEWETEALEL